MDDESLAGKEAALIAAAPAAASAGRPIGPRGGSVIPAPAASGNESCAGLCTAAGRESALP
ncbi:MAG TPA: hypothetical protein VGN43_20905 [Steroidobacteraceae bacterium]|nr:hypothetical protein [Steroidobacteraceae bacterium]